RVRSRQDVVLVHRCTTTRDRLALLSQRGFDLQQVAVALHVAMQVREIGGDANTLRVEPGAVADAVARVHRALALRAQIGAPRAVALARRCRETLTGCIGAREPPEITALGCAGDEEAHRA